MSAHAGVGGEGALRGGRREVCLLLGVAALSVSRPAATAPMDPSSTEQQRIAALGERLPTARLLWVNSGKIWHTRLDDWNPQRITDPSLSEGNPRWSPDGSKILFVREPAAVWVMDADFSGAEQLIPFADTATWTRDGRSITAISTVDRHQVIKHDTVTGAQAIIYDSTDPDYAGGYGANDPLDDAVELRAGGERFLLTFTSDRTPGGTHHTYIVDLQERSYLYNDEMDRGDCSPAWAPDGSYAITTARTTDRPVVRADFDPSGPSVAPSTVLIGLDPAVCGGCTSYYIHGQRVANDGQWLAFGGLPRSGDFANNREIYVWKIGEPEDSAVRVSFETLEDSSPDLYISPDEVDAGAPPDASQPDAAQPDASQPDAAQPDAGGGDASSPEAAQADIARGDTVHVDRPRPIATGCACGQSPSTTASVIAGLLALAAAARQRRPREDVG